MKYFVVVFVSALSLSACSGPDPATGPDQNVLMHNDFENLVGWVPENVALTSEQAHSGQYSLKVDPAHPYSLTYYSLLGKLSAARIRGVRVAAWAYSPTQNSGVRLSVGLNKAAGSSELLLSDGIAYDTAVLESGKWVKISKEITFPANITYTSQLVLYLWNGAGAGTAYLDDIQLTALR